MCEPVTLTAVAIGAAKGAAISMAVTGATNLATGQDFTSGMGTAALLGAAGGGLGGYAGATTGMAGLMNPAVTPTMSAVGNFIAPLAPSLTSIGVTSAAGSLFNSMTPDYSGYTPTSQYAQQFNSQQIATTGSGGRQAAASLAEAVQRSKQRKLTQEDVGDLSIDTSSFASTGLQLA